MEIPPKNKRFPWVWIGIGCGAVTIIIIALVVVLIFQALPFIRTTLANLNLNFSQTPAPQFNQNNPTVIPNPGLGNGTTIGELPFNFSAIQGSSLGTSQSLMDQMTSSLNLNNDTDFMAPKSYKGTATLDPTSGFTVGNGWCAADANTLQQNLANLQFQLSINGVNIDLSQYPTLNFSDSQGDACAMTGILITPNGNLNGSYHIVLTQKFLNSLDDGITGSPYPAGDVTFDFTIKFQVGPSSGSNT